MYFLGQFGFVFSSFVCFVSASWSVYMKKRWGQFATWDESECFD